MFSSFGGSKDKKAQAAKGGAAGEAALKAQREREEALRVITQHQAAVKKPMEQMHSVAGSQYWRYGYMGGTLLTAGALTFAISSKFPVFASVGSIASLGLGFVGGPKLHEFHVMALRQQVVKELDASIAALDAAGEKARADNKTSTSNAAAKEYGEALQLMRATRDEVLPPGMTITGGVDEETAKKAADLDGRVDQLLDAYAKRRGSLPADAPSAKA